MGRPGQVSLHRPQVVYSRSFEHYVQFRYINTNGLTHTRIQILVPMSLLNRT